MAGRTPRCQSKTDLYHLYARGCGRQLIYESDNDRLVFLDELANAAENAGIELYAYCLMDNHYHSVAKSPYEQLSKFEFELNWKYATYFNKTHERTGHLFDDRFGSQPIEDEAHFLAAIRYVHRNPVEAGMSPTCDFPWSSYGAYDETFCQADSFTRVPIATSKPLEMLGGVEGFRVFHSHPGRERFIDDRQPSKYMSDSETLAIAGAALGGLDPSSLKALPKPERDRYLGLLKLAGLTLSQIARLTGLSRPTVQRAHA